jgi:AraC-like DNA-binding protein
LINTAFQSNFFDFINTYRIEAAKKILEDPDKADWKILAIAYETGYNNKATFNRVFKKYTGYTPSAYRAAHLSQNA